MSMVRFLFISILSLVYLICEVSVSTLPCHFRCQDGNYLFDGSFCDGNSDCSNGDDESYGCDRAKCGSRKFKCTDGTCLNIRVRCDNKNDCTDGSDERNCGDEIDTDECPSREGSFFCDDESKCIDFKHVCDDSCNCADCSDERTGCSKYDNYICDKCSDTCRSTTHEAHKFSTAPSKEIILSPCKGCEFSHSCDQKCLSIEQSKERCVCDENYQSYPLNNYTLETSCKSNVSYENAILYSTTDEIKLYNFTSNTTITFRSNVDCTALAAAHDYIYYATFSNNIGFIFKTSIISNQTKMIVDSDYPILSMDVDWITGNIYFTTEESISVCSNNGQTCAKLRSCSNCHLKLAPKLGLMFWNEDTTLYRSAMDGSKEENFSRVTEMFERINFFNYSRLLFAIDEAKESVFLAHELPFPLVTWSRLYSNMHTQFLIRGNFDGKELVDFDEFENVVYFTLEDTNEIFHSDNMKQYTNSRSILIDQNATAIKIIYVYNRLLQRTKIPNPCNETSCSLCLLKPFSPFIGLNWACACGNLTKYDHKFICASNIDSASNTIPDATAKKREVYDVYNPPPSWIRKNSSSKTETVSIARYLVMIGLTLIGIAAGAGVLLFYLRYKRKIIENDDCIREALYGDGDL
ncbi:vitellogenin receptor-like isoform X2 [Planococcus citri]|uniref:vitellogenin receptor-like isoform X2 n=1 Tax=Planococcus citri TaxID=170843 RepID=UPI0031F9D95D